MLDVQIATRVVSDDDESFEVLVLNPSEPTTLALFAAGAGGDPERHLPLLQTIAARGCIVVAPRFDRLLSPTPSAAELAVRGRRLGRALYCVGPQACPRVVGVAHSIGAALLLVLAGAVATTTAGDVVRIPAANRFSRLALMAPATDFFRTPSALQNVTASIAIWAGEKDDITQPLTTEIVTDELRAIASVDVRIAPNAGHFSFMNVPPPHAREALVDRDAFLGRLAGEVADFAVG